jgi:hypothetical protein
LLDRTDIGIHVKRIDQVDFGHFDSALLGLDRKAQAGFVSLRIITSVCGKSVAENLRAKVSKK